MNPNDLYARRRFGLLVLWAILPLPFSLIVLPPFYLAVIAAALFLIFVPSQPIRLSLTLKNVLGLLILFAVISAGGLRVGPLRPLGHLLLLLLAVQALMATSRRDTTRLVPLLGVVWMVSIASATHLLLVGYLIASAAIAWWLGMRLILEREAPEGTLKTNVEFPQWRHAAVAGLLAFVVGLPIFLAMPRLRSPWIAGLAGARGVSGFSTAVELAAVGEIQESQDVALVVRSLDGSSIDPSMVRLRATAFDLQRTGVWTARRSDFEMPQRRGQRYWLREDQRSLRGTQELEIDMVAPERYLFVPYGTIAIQVDRQIAVDSAGGVVLGWRRRTADSRVWVDDNQGVLSDRPTDTDLFVSRDHPGVRDLANTLTVGLSSHEQIAEAIRNHLSQNYDYSTSNQARFSSDPVAWFLLEGRRGHCEFFAGSMVVMLRMLDVPARMVGGYLGGTVMGRGREVIVRQSNAHAWVEVWLGENRGWVLFDPTPASGVPTFVRVTGWRRVQWAWDWLQVNWDRWVVGFGLDEQVTIVTEVVELGRQTASELQPRHYAWTAFLLLGGATGIVLRKRIAGAIAALYSRRSAPATGELRKIARRLERAGETLRPGSTWRQIGKRALARWPRGGPAIDVLVGLAEHELYSSEKVTLEHRTRAETACADWRAALS